MTPAFFFLWFNMSENQVQLLRTMGIVLHSRVFCHGLCKPLDAYSFLSFYLCSKSINPFMNCECVHVLLYFIIVCDTLKEYHFGISLRNMEYLGTLSEATDVHSIVHTHTHTHIPLFQLSVAQTTHPFKFQSRKGIWENASKSGLGLRAYVRGVQSPVLQCVAVCCSVLQCV